MSSLVGLLDTELLLSVCPLEPVHPLGRQAAGSIRLTPAHFSPSRGLRPSSPGCLVVL